MNGLQPVPGMMPMAHEDAVGAERRCDLEIVDGVADQERPRGLGVEAVEQRPPGVYLAGRMAIVTADDLGEVMLDAEVTERVVQCVLLLRRQDGLRHAAVRQTLELRARGRRPRAFVEPRDVPLATLC